MNLFLQCRLKFYFRYVLGLKKPKSAALHVGSAVHSVLKSWSKPRWKQQPLTLKELHESFTKAWADDSEGAVSWEDTTEEEEQMTGWRLIETYIRESPVQGDEMPDAVEVSVEADLHEHGLPTLIGVLDLVQSSKIIDFKTAGQIPNAERAAHTNEVQACLYAVLYRDATGKQEAGIEFHHLVKLKKPKLVVISLPSMSEQQQTRLFHLIEAYGSGLDRRDFIPSPGLQCASCEFVGECRKWS